MHPGVVLPEPLARLSSVPGAKLVMHKDAEVFVEGQLQPHVLVVACPHRQLPPLQGPVACARAKTGFGHPRAASGPTPALQQVVLRAHQPYLGLPSSLLAPTQTQGRPHPT